MANEVAVWDRALMENSEKVSLTLRQPVLLVSFVYHRLVCDEYELYAVLITRGTANDADFAGLLCLRQVAQPRHGFVPQSIASWRFRALPRIPQL